MYFKREEIVEGKNPADQPIRQIWCNFSEIYFGGNLY